MNFRRHLQISLALSCLLIAHFSTAASPTLDELVKLPVYDTVKLSPDGKKLAVSVVEEGKRVLALMSLDPLKITYVLRFTQNEEVGTFYWVNKDRVVVDIIRRFGLFDSPLSNGKLYALDFDGRNGRTIFGYDARERQLAHATVISMLHGQRNKILISTHPWSNVSGGYRYAGDRIGEVLKIDVYSGRTSKVMTHPARGGVAYATRDGDIRFAAGNTDDDRYALFQRKDDEWIELACDDFCTQQPIGYSADGREAYLASNRDAETIGIELYNMASGQRRLLFRDEQVDIDSFEWHPGSEQLLYVITENGKPEYTFIDESHSYNRFFRGLLKAFQGQRVELHSATPDGKMAIVRVSADNMPGDFFLANRETKQLGFLFSSAGWLKPESLARTEVIKLQARDGISLQGYFTRPNTGAAPYPTVVLPHGGPSARDYWRYNFEAQILSAQGYGVLQLNFRGSTGYGKSFQRASDLAWGTEVQDDIADATRWAIANGLSRPDKICIYGASFGGFSALMNAIREPELYQCAAGFAGVYDLELMHRAGDIKETSMGRAYLERVIGKEDLLHTQSPIELIATLKTPLFIAHGGQDERVPIAHAEAVVAEVEKLDVPLTTHFNASGGHGFYTEESNKAYYTDLLAFLATYLQPGD